MKPVRGDLGRPALYLLGLLGAVKAAGLVLVAQGVASGLASLFSHTDAWRSALWIGLLGAALRGLSTWALQAASARISLGVKEKLRARVLDRAVTDARGSVGATTTVATAGLDELDRYYTVFLPTLVGAVAVPLLVGLRILAADWVSALIVVLTIPLIPVFMALIGLHTRDSVAQATSALARLSDHLVELARGLPVLIGLGREREQSAALRKLSDDWRVTSLGTLRTAFQSALALELIATLSVALVAVFVGVRLVSGTMTLEAGLLALVLAPECYAPFRDIGSAFHASQTGLDARRRVQEVLDQASGGADLARTAAEDGIAVTGLTVRHAGRASDAVSRLSFTARPGTVVAIDGPSGAGKSTALRVLAGRGAELDDDALVSGAIAAPTELAWLPQHPQFAREGAVAELIAYGATDAVARTLLERLGLPDADPARLSPGEQRRLAFARVLARVDDGVRVALLDEPTAHLDPASAALVRAEIGGLRARGVAVVVASHDPELRALADERVTLGEPTTAAVVTFSPSSAPHGRLSDDRAEGAAARSSESARNDPAQRDFVTTGGTGDGGGALRELARVLAPAGWKLAGAIGLGTLAALFATALTALSGWLIVRAAEHPPILFLEVAIVGVRFFGLGRAALRYAERLVTHDAVFASLTELRMRLWSGLAAQGPAGRVELTAANTLDRLIGDGDRVRDLAPRVVVPLASGVIALLAAVVALWVLWAPAGVLLLACCVVALGGGAAVAVAADARASRGRDLDRSAIVRRVAALLAARDDLAANGAAAGELEAVSRAGARAAASARHSATALGAGAALATLACAATAMGMLLIAVPAHAAGTLPVPLIAVFVLTPLALIEPVLEAIGAAQHWPELAQVLRRVAPVTAAADTAEHEEPGLPVAPVRGIRLADLAYRYPQAERDVFAHVSARAAAGETLVVTGPSGSGKTTLLGVLLRYLAPTAGRYLLGEADAALLDPDGLRRRVAWCPQEGHLFDSTLRGNLQIARGRDDQATDAELIDVIEQVGLGPLLATLPLGLDTPIGSGGAFLSGGQRQRVAVARTLLADADVVLLDEPTAHLDSEAAEALIVDLGVALRQKTQVLVTHDARFRGAGTVLELGGQASARLNVTPSS
ncbi:thiol reductant ABC exporter subunit CydC [Gryllotalpicola protaetiae]|uniref:thiol reductant ABC exporter subunit CydC n=1 Tax=Gryllotalpicola protaetiae TaxID=2419771 RepID=UPI0013C52570|nr:thiol reductant ABC exporter subunit CydC [Gryllotalpicola protaetiae]